MRTLADLKLTKVAAANPAQTGQTLLYTLTVRNLGPAAAADVVVTDTLPAGVSFVAAASSPGCAETGAG